MGCETIFVPLGEADGVCVVIAEERGGYVLGQDSDFAILVAEGGKGRGYVPFESTSWFVREEEVQETEEAFEEETDEPKMEAGEDTEKTGSVSGTCSQQGQQGLKPDKGFTTVVNRKRPYDDRNARQSKLLPPPDVRNPTLSLVVYPPSALRQRLRLPATVLPLFGALVGNDFTPPQAALHFFESTLSLGQRIEKVARVLREQLFSPNANKSGSAGDDAVDLVSRVIKKLTVRDFNTESERHALADAIVEATLQYTLPTMGKCCSRFPFCGNLDTGCRAELGLSEAVERYSDAHKRGELRGVRHAFLFPDSVVPYQVMEDPSKASIKLGKLCAVRKAAWEIADEAVGLRFARSDKEEDQQPDVSAEAGKEETTSEATVVDDTVPKVEAVDGGQPEVVTETSTTTTPRNQRTVIEYVRSSNRIIARECHLDEPEQIDGETKIRCLQPLEDRLNTYLEVMQCNIPSVCALPIHYQPLVAIIRFCLSETRETWRQMELKGILRATIGTYAAWKRDQRGDCPTKEESTIRYPYLTSRKAQIVAYIQAVMTDAHILAESLLLSNHPTCKDSRGDIDITHLRTYVFYSGSVLHLFLSGEEPGGWKWGQEEQDAFDTCLPVIAEGLETKILGWAESHPEAQDGGAAIWRRGGPKLQPAQESKQQTQQHATEASDSRSTTQATHATSSSSTTATANGNGNGKRGSRADTGNWRDARTKPQSGRFDLLNGMTSP